MARQRRSRENGMDIPQGLSQMMAKNPDKLAVFGQMDDWTRGALIQQARQAQSRDEMEALVARIGDPHHFE